MHQRRRQLPEEMRHLPTENAHCGKGECCACGEKSRRGADDTAGACVILCGVMLGDEFADGGLQAELKNCGVGAELQDEYPRSVHISGRGEASKKGGSRAAASTLTAKRRSCATEFFAIVMGP